MRLQEISGGSGSEQSSETLRTLAVAEVLANFPIAPHAQFYSIVGNAKNSRKADATMTSGANRTIATTYTAKENTPDTVAAALKIYGDLVQTDLAHERRGGDIGSQRVKDLTNFAQSLGRYLMDSFINDEVSATKFSGLKEQCTTLSRKSVFDTANGGTLPTGNASADVKQAQKFREFLDAQINDIVGGVDCIVANGAFKARLGTIAERFVTTTQVSDIYGQNYSVQSYQGIPVVNAGFKANKTGLIIDQAETEGTSADCTSIYLIKFGEEENTSFATNVGLDVHDLGRVGTKYQTLVELDLDLVICDLMSVKRLSGIRLSA